MWPIFAAAAAALGGQLFGAEAQSDEASAARDAQNAARLQDQALAREFAQMGIQWRVEDAIKAGVHPLYALGGPGASYSGGGFQPVMANTGQFYQQMGQDVSRAIMASQATNAKEMQELQLEHQRLLNDKLFLDVYGSAGSPRGDVGTGPGMPAVTAVYGGAEMGPMLTHQHPDARRSAIVEKPVEIQAQRQGNPSVTEGHHAILDAYHLRTRQGKEGTIYLPANKGSAGEALESVAESPFVLYAVIAENRRMNPNFAYEYAHLFPGGELLWTARDIVTEAMAREAMRGSRMPAAEIPRSPSVTSRRTGTRIHFPPQ